MGYKNENEQINVQKIKEDTHINPSDLFFWYSVDMWNKFRRINNLFLKDWWVNRYASLATTKNPLDDNFIEEKNPYNRSIFDYHFTDFWWYYYLQWWSNMMVIHDIQKNMLLYMNRMKDLLQ
jgi:hypothetical protein